MQLSSRFPNKPRLSRSSTEISSYEVVMARQEVTIASQESEISGHKEVITRQEAMLSAGDAKVELARNELALLYVDIQKMISSK